VGAKATQQLKGGDSSRDPGNVYLTACGDEEAFVVVAPRQSSHRRLKKFFFNFNYIQPVKIINQNLLKLDPIFYDQFFACYLYISTNLFFS